MAQHFCQISFKPMKGCRSWEDKLKCVKILSVKDHNSAKICQTWIIFSHALRLVVQHRCNISFKSIQGCRRIWEDKLKCVKILSVKDHNSAKICQTWIISPHALLPVVQHHCKISVKYMQECRRSWEDKLKCVNILNVKDYNSAKIFQTWIISPYVILDLWCNIPARFHSNPCKAVRRSWEDTLKFVKILSVKGHNSAKFCRTWTISPHALLDLWCNTPAKFHSNPCKDVGCRCLMHLYNLILTDF